MIELQTAPDSNTVSVTLRGKLRKDDYATFSPNVEELIRQRGKLRMLVEMHDFHGWDMGALWEDIKFDLKHFADIERVAFVGDRKWQKGMSGFCKPFTRAKVRYFERGEEEQAAVWLEAV